MQLSGAVQLATTRPEPVRVGIATIRRAYDYGHHDELREAVKEGKKPQRGRCAYIGAVRERRIRGLVAAGVSDKEAAAKVGVGISTVGRLQRQMMVEQSGRNLI